jgi:carbon monoxide dehydrogenase subunit G
MTAAALTQAFARSTVIDAAPDTVWRVLTDFPQAGRWMPGTCDLRLDGELRPGAVLHFTARGKPRSSVVTDMIDGRSLTLTSTQGPVTAAYTYTVQGSGSSTRVDLVVGLAVGGVLRLLTPVIRTAMAKEDGGQLDRLGAAVCCPGD